MDSIGGWDDGGGCDWFDPFCWPVSPCIFDICGGGGGGGGGGDTGGSGGGGNSSNTPRSTPLPPNSFPGGETLGLPSGMRVPLPSPAVLLGLNLNLNCEFGVCVGGVEGFRGGSANSWSSNKDYEGAFMLAAGLLRDFVAGSSFTNRTYYSLAPESVDLQRSAGFRTTLRNACSSGKSAGPFNVGTYQAAFNLPYDLVHSPTGAQVGGYVGTYSVQGNSISIRIHNEAGANSFFYHRVPNSPFSRGPFRTINQDFSITLSNPCGK